MSYPYAEEAGKLSEALQFSCKHIASGSALAFSGGLDSSVLAFLLGDRAKLYVSGLEGSGDLKAAERAGGILGNAPTVAPIDDVEALLGAVGRAVPRKLLAIEATILVPFAAVCAAAKEKIIITGQGADELFGGYARYLRKSPADAAAEMKGDLQRLLERGARHERLVAEAFGKEVSHPFLHENVIASAQVAPEAHFHDGKRKVLLMEAARAIGLPEQLIGTPKRAAQYGSGATKAIARAAKEKKMGVPEYVERALGKR